jgi:1-acyl-sn-glycerol-3-phosphate acyltransferase
MSDESPLPTMSSTELTTRERFSVALGERINRGGWAKTLGMAWARHVASRFVRVCSRKSWEIEGFEAVEHLKVHAGVVIVANHRSLYDLYIIVSVLFARCHWFSRVYFPVRSSFWYSALSGVLVNLLMAGGAMWPPIFREREKIRLNKVAMDQLAHVLGTSGAVIGFHPEGTRNKSPDPFSFLPAKPGLGKLLKSSDPQVTVVPVYINGLSNSFFREMIRNIPFIGQSPPEPIRMYFGTPVRICDLPDLSPKKQSEYLMDCVIALAKKDPRHPEHTP